MYLLKILYHHCLVENFGEENKQFWSASFRSPIWYRIRSYYEHQVKTFTLLFFSFMNFWAEYGDIFYEGLSDEGQTMVQHVH